MLAHTIDSPNFASVIYEDHGKHYVLSEVSEVSIDKSCANGNLYCADYSVTIAFFIKNTKKSSGVIQMKNVEVGLLDMKDPDKTYTADDMIVLNESFHQTHEIKIIQATNNPVTPPKDVVTNQKPTTATKKDTTKSTITAPLEEVSKSSNANLKSLEIKDYPIEFKEYRKSYTIIIPKEVNELTIKATTEDQKATYKIIGAKDLKANHYEVCIEVTAENKNKKKYIIHTKIKEETDQEVSKEKKTPKIDNKVFFYVGIPYGILMILIIIIVIVSKIKKRKLEKMLDQW